MKHTALKITLALLSIAIMITPVTMAAEINTLDTTMLTEGFEHAGSLPDGWLIIGGSGTPSAYQWKIVASAPGVPVHSGTYAAKVRGRQTQGQDEWLVTNEIDLSTIEEGQAISLTYWTYTYIVGQSQIQTVKCWVSHDEMFDEDDTEVWDLRDEASWTGSFQWRQATVELNDFAGDSVWIAWQYTKTGSANAVNFTMDDITIVVGEPRPKASLAVGSFSYGSRVSAKILNDGPIDAEAVEWTMEIIGGSRGGIEVVTSGEIEKLYRQGHWESTGTASSGSIFGFGPVEITVTLKCDNARPDTVSRTAKGFVILSKCYPWILSNQSWEKMFL